MPNCQECFSLYFLVINNPFSIFQKAKGSIESFISLYILLITFCLCTVPFSLITRIPTNNKAQLAKFYNSFIPITKWKMEFVSIDLVKIIVSKDIRYRTLTVRIRPCVCVCVYFRVLHEFAGKLVCMFSFEMKKS